MRLRRMLVVLLGPLSVTACSLVAGLGDVTLYREDGGKASSSDGASKTDGGALDGAPTDGGSTTPPSWCNGIVLYASFDTKLSGDRGGSTVYGSGGVTQSTQGKFGRALSLVSDASTTETLAQGAALFFVGSAQASPFPENEGSLAVWYKQAPGTTWGTNPEAPVLYRPVATLPPADLQTAGLAFYLFGFNNVTGLVERSGADQNQVLTFDSAQTAPYMKTGDFNHFVTAWSKTGATSALYAINGGLGTPLSGTGQTYPLTDAGELHTPFRSFTGQRWVSEGAAIGVRLGGLGTNTPEGIFDDLVVWSRVIALEEAAAVYQSNRPVGELCNLVAR